MDMEFQALPFMEQFTVLAEITPRAALLPCADPSPIPQTLPKAAGTPHEAQHPARVGMEPSAHPWSPAHPPAQQAQLAGAVLVHDNSQGQRDGTEQEGADGEGQVQHFVLGVAGRPFVL